MKTYLSVTAIALFASLGALAFAQQKLVGESGRRGPLKRVSH